MTFGSCNNLAKINAEVVAAWAEILRRVPAARLLLKYRGLEDEGLRARYLDLFAAQGIAADRLDIEGWSPLGELLARHDRIDVALDPFPFAGGVTTCNALWMGVPVVTWPGETFASRHALSYLSTVGLTETIAGSREEYVEIAARLAADLRLACPARHPRGCTARRPGEPRTDALRLSGRPICAIDILFGHRGYIARGNHFMVHKTGFTAEESRSEVEERPGLPRSASTWIRAFASLGFGNQVKSISTGKHL